MERNRRQAVNPFEDPTPVTYDKQHIEIRASSFAQIFHAHRDDPDWQIRLAKMSIERYVQKERTIDADLVLSWISDQEAKNTVRVWCKGKNIRLKEEDENTYERAHVLLAEDEDLISKLSPHLSRIDLARILTLRRYQEADPDTQQTLVYGTYRLLSDYLGPRRYYRREFESFTPLPLPDIPAEIFDNELIRKILRESERESILPIFNRDAQAADRYLEEMIKISDHPMKRQLVEELRNHFAKSQEFKVEGFKDRIPGSQKDIEATEEIVYSSYPTRHQREFAYRFVTKPIGKVDLLIGDTGTMKSGGSIYAMEAAGTKTTAVVCPSGINKLGWRREIEEKYAQPVEVITVESERQLRELAENPRDKQPRYLIIGYQLLSRLNNQDSQKLLQQLVHNLKIDSLIADEVHLAKEPQADCSQQLYLLSSLLPEAAPRIAMTATGVVNSVDDLDAPVRVLFPYRYPSRGDFTRAVRNDPDLVPALLHGSQIMTRWTKDLLDLPPLVYGTEADEAVPLSAFHQILYEYVYMDDTIESQVKRGMLRQVSLDPLLIRRHYHPDGIKQQIEKLRNRQNLVGNDKEKANIAERIKALEERSLAVSNLSNEQTSLRELKEAHEKYIEWKSINNQDEIFNEDFLVKIGNENVALWSFFTQIGGIDELVRKSGDIELIRDWQGKKDVFSSKYLKLKKLIDERLKDRKGKVIIYSGFYQHEVSSGIEDLIEDDELAFLSLYDHLRSWYGDKKVIKIDGTVSIEPRAGELAERERIRRVWRNDPETIMLCTTRSARLGIDLSVPDIQANKDIEKVTEIFLDYPDTFADVDQTIGRVWRPGQKSVVEAIFLRSTNNQHPRTFRYGFIDYGLREALEFKRLLSQMVLDGVPLTEDEEKFVRSHLSNLTVQQLYPQTPKSYLNEIFYNQVRGKGVKILQEFFKTKGFEDMTNADFFATYYPENDEISLAGHNARGITEIIKILQQGRDKEDIKIGSVGAGAGILQKTLGQQIVNIDLLPEILHMAQTRFNDQGDYLIGEASQLPIQSESFDITDASLMLHWTTNSIISLQKSGFYSERAKVIAELNRVTKQDGTVIITLPPSYLTPDQFEVWKNALEQYFGFVISKDVPSGLLKATDFKTESVSWVFNLKKVAEPESFLPNISVLNFEFENPVRRISSSGNGTRNPKSVIQAMPHREFEIVEPSTGRSSKLSYQPPSVDELEKLLFGEDEKSFSSELEVLTRLGLEEYGLYRRLVKEAKSRWHLSSYDVEKLAIESINKWLEYGTQKDNPQGTWSELRFIMEEVRKKNHESK